MNQIKLTFLFSLLVYSCGIQSARDENEAYVSTEEAVSYSSDSEKLNLGKALYKSNCENCHGKIDVSDKRNKLPSDIAYAIGEVNSMLGLEKLTDLEIELISDALSDDNED